VGGEDGKEERSAGKGERREELAPQCYSRSDTSVMVGWRVVARWSRSTKLPYVGPGLVLG